MGTSTFTVSGMTCGHCVTSVKEEISELTGVTDVQVDLTSGRLTVVGDASAQAVIAAVSEAGYSATASD